MYDMLFSVRRNGNVIAKFADYDDAHGFAVELHRGLIEIVAIGSDFVYWSRNDTRF